MKSLAWMIAPTPSPAPRGGEVLAAGRARGRVAKTRNPPQALQRIRVEGAVKGSPRRASPALDRPLNAPSMPAPSHCNRTRPSAISQKRDQHFIKSVTD